MLLFAALFVISNVVFALVYYVGDARVMNSHGFLDDLWFSVQTMCTIGYGYLAPAGTLANTIVSVESFFGIVLTALFTGVFFARFSTPVARIVFSRVAIIGEHDGHRSLMFRMANERTTAIVEATIHLYTTRDEKLANGETMRRVYDLSLRRNTSPVFALSFLAVHTIDDKSPLYNMSPDDLRDTNMNIVVTFTGIDDLLATTIHSRYSWSYDDIVFDKKFVDIFGRDESGNRFLDLGPIHETEPVRAISSASPTSLE